MSKNTKGFFQIISEASSTDKILVLLISLLYSATSILSVTLPILFKDPTIYCENPDDKTLFLCSEKIACSNEFKYFIDKENGPKSFSSEYELICDNSSLKRLALTFYYLGYLVAAILQILIVIEDSKKKNMMFKGGLAIFLGLILMILFNKFGLDFQFICYLFFINGIWFIYVNTYCLIYIGEKMSHELSGVAIVSMCAIWGIFGIFYALLGYFTNANWKILILVASLFIFVCSFGIFLINPNKKNNTDEENEVETEEVISICSYLKDLWPNKIIRNNFIVYTLVWSFYCCVYSVQYVELESVGGSLESNSIFCCILEIFSTLVATLLTQRYSARYGLNKCVSIVTICFLFYFFAPLSIASSSGVLSFFFLICLLISKLSNDLINLLIYLSLPIMFTDKYIGVYVILSRAFNRLLLTFMPTMNYLSREFGFHPFFLYGVIFAICRILLNFTKEVVLKINK